MPLGAALRILSISRWMIWIGYIVSPPLPGITKAERMIFMKQVNIPFVENEIDWTAIPQIAIQEQVRVYESEATAYAQICYTKDALQVRLTANEPEILRNENDPLGMPCKDSCLEFFFCPKVDDIRYFNFEFNPNACMFLGFGPSIDELTRLIPIENQKEELFAPEVSFHDGGWSVCFRVPYAFIRRFVPDFTPEPGSAIKGNFYKCGELLQQPHCLAWCMVAREGRSIFHTPEQFGTLHFI